MFSQKEKLIERRGFTYNVYDIGNGRVLKKEKPRIQQYLLHLPFRHSPKYVRTHRLRARKLMKALSGAELVGNPMRVNNRSYAQDKAIILDAYFATHALEENKKILDGYIQSIFDTWQHGFSDIIFNFTRNCGVVPNGRVILVDFNEVTFDKEEVRRLIESKRFFRALSYTHGLPGRELKEYYRNAMEEQMTVANLDRYWKDNEQLLAKT